MTRILQLINCSWESVHAWTCEQSRRRWKGSLTHTSDKPLAHATCPSFSQPVWHLSLKYLSFCFTTLFDSRLLIPMYRLRLCRLLTVHHGLHHTAMQYCFFYFKQKEGEAESARWPLWWWWWWWCCCTTISWEILASKPSWSPRCETLSLVFLVSEIKMSRITSHLQTRSCRRHTSEWSECRFLSSNTHTLKGSVRRTNYHTRSKIPWLQSNVWNFLVRLRVLRLRIRVFFSFWPKNTHYNSTSPARETFFFFLEEVSNIFCPVEMMTQAVCVQVAGQQVFF